MLSLPSTLLRCSGTVCKAHSVIPILKRGSVTYSIWHQSRLTTWQIKIISRNSIYFLQRGWWKLLSFAFYLTPAPHACILKIHFKFPSPSHSACLTPPLLHFLMQRNNGAALRGCESLPKLCVGGPFLSGLHSQAAFNIHSFFSDVSERYLGSFRLWRSDLATAKNVKYGGAEKKKGLSGLYQPIWTLSRAVCFRSWRCG